MVRCWNGGDWGLGATSGDPWQARLGAPPPRKDVERQRLAHSRNPSKTRPGGGLPSSSRGGASFRLPALPPQRLRAWPCGSPTKKPGATACTLAPFQSWPASAVCLASRPRSGGGALPAPRAEAGPDGERWIRGVGWRDGQRSRRPKRRVRGTVWGSRRGKSRSSRDGRLPAELPAASPPHPTSPGGARAQKAGQREIRPSFAAAEPRRRPESSPLVCFRCVQVEKGHDVARCSS